MTAALTVVGALAVFVAGLFVAAAIIHTIVGAFRTRRARSQKPVVLFSASRRFDDDSLN